MQTATSDDGRRHRRTIAGRTDTRHQPLGQFIGCSLADRNGDRYRHTTLAGGAIAGANQRIDRLIHIGIGHDDHVIFCAAETLHAFAVLRGARINICRNRR